VPSCPIEVAAYTNKSQRCSRKHDTYGDRAQYVFFRSWVHFSVLLVRRTVVSGLMTYVNLFCAWKEDVLVSRWQFSGQAYDFEEPFYAFR